jgi:Protein of unknown function (DUF1566)
MNKTLLTIITLILTIAIGAQVANAIGSLTPSGTAGDATQYTLNDIYTKLTANTSTSTKSGMFTTPGSAVATFRTLTEIYNAIPTIDATKVASGTSYLGVTGTLATTTPELEWSTNQGYLNWGTAISTCAALTEGGATAGDWRLPTIQEYQSITDFSIYDMPTHIPGFIQYFNYWSSTGTAENPNNAWGWSSYNGGINNLGKANLYQVRCVR